MNILEVKHVLLYESPLDLLIRPIDKQLVVKVSFGCQTTTEEYRVLQVCSVPVSLKQYTKLLSPPQRKNRDENFPTSV